MLKITLKVWFKSVVGIAKLRAEYHLKCLLHCFK